MSAIGNIGSNPYLYQVVEEQQKADPNVMHDGSRMEGNFDRDGNGEGKRIFTDGHVWEGTFKDWFLEGKGKHTLPDGTILEGQFKRSTLQNS